VAGALVCFSDGRGHWSGRDSVRFYQKTKPASFGLIYEGINYHLGKTVIGVIAGLVFIYLTHKLLDRFEGMHHFEGNIFEGLKKGSLKKAVLIVLIMTVHSAAEGIGIGTSFGGGMTFGLIMSLAIAVHNIPEGLAISAVLTSRGMPWWKAALWSIFTSLPQPLMAVPAFLFIQAFKPLLPAGLGFAAGAMLWLTLSEIIPDAYEDIKPDARSLNAGYCTRGRRFRAQCLGVAGGCAGSAGP